MAKLTPAPLRAEPGVAAWRGTWAAADFASNGVDTSACTLCPHECVLSEGEAGHCAVRRRRQGRLETAAFATLSRHWTPVERKPLYHFRPGLQVLTLSPPGCTMGCLYCQNQRASQVGRTLAAVDDAARIDVAEVVAEAVQRQGAIALSYSEPTLGAELTLALADAGEMPLIWKTNGFITAQALQRIAPHLAAVNVDLKSADPRAHQRLTGAPLAPVLAAIEMFRSHDVWVEISTPLIDGFNDAPEQVDAMARTIAAISSDIPWHLLRVTPEYRLLDIDPTSPATLGRARSQGLAAGLRYVYVERALDIEGRTTQCPGCQLEVVRRDIWRTERVLHTDGHCPRCGQVIAGIWIHSPIARMSCQ